MRRKPLERTKELARYFEPGTGERLDVKPSPPWLEDVGFARKDLLTPRDSAGPFGRFQILVLSDPSEAQRYVAFGTPDENGAHWYVGEADRGPDAGIPTASATKVYGNDIVLTWFRGDELTETDERWHRLDCVLTDFVDS